MPVAVANNVVAETTVARQEFPSKIDLQRPLYLPHGKWAAHAASVIKSNDQGILLNRAFHWPTKSCTPYSRPQASSLLKSESRLVPFRMANT